MKAKDVRKGQVIIFKNVPHRVLDFHHHTPGNLRAMVHLKLRNLMTGYQAEDRVGSTDDLEMADMSSYHATYLYNDGDGYHFMNSETYDQIAISAELLGNNVYFLQENMQVDILNYNGEPISVTLPQTVVLLVVETEPEIRGSTASNSPKPAKTDSGLVLNVPTFVKVGDKILVNTEETKYLSRVD